MNRGQCLCGTVRYEVSGPFNTMMSCHCSRCRKHHGSTFSTFVSSPHDGFAWRSGQDAIVGYASSENSMRYSCNTCGAVVPILMPKFGLALCPAGQLEGELGITPQAHIFAASRAPWYSFTDSLPRHDEYPPEFGAAALPSRTVESKPGMTQGSCLCGDVAYEASGDPLFMFNCHCQRCRRARGAAHGTNIFFKVDQFRWVRGEDKVVDYKLPAARFFAVAFCRGCGGGLPRISQERGIVVIPAGSLDTEPAISPQAHIFVGSKAGWFDITDSLPQHVEMPPRP
jgi:hypothetical protein